MQRAERLVPPGTREAIMTSPGSQPINQKTGQWATMYPLQYDALVGKSGAWGAVAVFEPAIQAESSLHRLDKKSITSSKNSPIFSVSCPPSPTGDCGDFSVSGSWNEPQLNQTFRSSSRHWLAVY
jgi:hypothetical protein